MTSLLKRNLHQMVDYAASDKVITACIGREDVCRFLLHSFMDYMTDHGLYDSSFQVLIDWSKQLNVFVDDKEWKVKKQTNGNNIHSNSPSFVYNPKERSPSISSNHNISNHNTSNHKYSNSYKRRKKSLKKRSVNKSNINKLFVESKPSLTPSNSVPVTPMSETNIINHYDEDEKLQSPKIKTKVPINNKMPSLTITQSRWIDENETESDHDKKENKDSEDKEDDDDNNNNNNNMYNRYTNKIINSKTTKIIYLSRPRAKSHGAPSSKTKSKKNGEKRKKKNKIHSSNSNTLATLKRKSKSMKLRIKENKLRLSSTSPAMTPKDKQYSPQYSPAHNEDEEDNEHDWGTALKLYSSNSGENNNNNKERKEHKDKDYINSSNNRWSTSTYKYQRRWTNDSEVSDWNLTHQRKWSVGSWSDKDSHIHNDDNNNNNNNIIDDENKKHRRNSVSIGDHEKNLIVAKHAKNILNNIDEDEKYSLSRLGSQQSITSDDRESDGSSTNYGHNYLIHNHDVNIINKPIDYIQLLSHSTWMIIAQFLDTSSKAAGLGLVSREMNLLCSHPLCWKKLKIKIDNLTKVSLNVMRRLFKNLTRFELNWNNPETPLSLLYGDGINGYNHINNHNNNYHLNNRINGYMALKYSKEIELFFSNLSLICNDSLHTFKLSMHGGPYRLANSAPTSVKIFQTETLLRLVFSNFNNLRKFKMDAYNLIAVDVFTSLLKKYSPNLQFFESQIVVYNRQTQRVILENPVLLNDINILPSTLKHLCLPLLADDSWIIYQYLPNLEYLFFFGYTRSSGYALHENFLSIRCLDYIAGQKSNFPNCPKIKIIEIALRQNDYLPIILRPIIRKLFLRCQYLENVKLATAGNLDLAQSLYSSLRASNLQVCNVFAKDEGRPEKPIGVVEFRRNHNYKFIHNNNLITKTTHLSVPNITYENEETVSELAIGGRLRG